MEKYNPIWYFDATGSILKKVPNQGDCKLYSIVCHDNTKRKIIPVAEFFTTDHHAYNISKYLITIRYNYEQELPLIVVTDNSKALINSVLNIFNKCDITEYLFWCSEIFLKQRTELSKKISVRIYLCCAHYLHNIVYRVKKFNCDNTVKKFFIFCFTILQNSITIDEIENYLINIYNIFNNEFLDGTVEKSKAIIDQTISQRNLDAELSFLIRDVEQANKQSDVEDFTDLTNNSSPFKSYFDKKILDYQNIIKDLKTQNKNCMAFDKNLFYNPELFKIIQEKLETIVLWSGLIINNARTISIQKTLNFKTRLHNGKVECRFKHVKSDLLQKRDDLLPSEYTSITYEDLKFIFKTYYYNGDKSINDIDIINYNPLSETEKWNKSRKKFKGTKGYWYNSDFYINEPTKEANRNDLYFLKLSNNLENSCYSNVIVQALLNLGEKLYFNVNSILLKLFFFNFL